MNLYNCTTIVPKGVYGLIFCSITHTSQPSRAIGENRHPVVCIVSLKTLEPEKDLEPHQLQHDLSMSCNQSGQHLQQEETANQFLAVARLSINTSYIVCHLLSQQSERMQAPGLSIKNLKGLGNVIFPSGCIAKPFQQLFFTYSCSCFFKSVRHPRVITMSWGLLT